MQRRAGLAIVLGGAAIVAVNDPTHSSAELFSLPVVFGLAWLAGFALRERAAEAEAAEERAAQAARLAVAEERTRIARELHDIVAHAVSVMVLQAGAVRHRLQDGDDAEALRDVEATGRTALAEMRRLLGAMRRDDEDAELGPQPGLASARAAARRVRPRRPAGAAAGRRRLRAAARAGSTSPPTGSSRRA